MRSEMGHTWVDLHVALLDNYRQFNLPTCGGIHSKIRSSTDERRATQWRGEIPPHI